MRMSSVGPTILQKVMSILILGLSTGSLDLICVAKILAMILSKILVIKDLGYALCQDLNQDLGQDSNAPGQNWPR